MTGDWERWLGETRAHRKQEQLERQLLVTDAPAEPVARRGGRPMVNLSTNNYLGLAGHPALVEAAKRGAERGAGAGSSRLVAGHDPAYAALEERLADFKGTEAALVFGSGYLANVGMLAALLDRESVVLSDELNHASIVDGARLSGAEKRVYRHSDLDHLESLLREAASGRRKLVVTDTVFSMDGDVAPLAGIVELTERYGAALVVDEAHGGGVFGPRGEGYAHELGLAGRVDLDMGTFSKAFGVYGAYVAGSRAWIDHLVSTCRTLIYSTALPPPVVSAIDASLDLVRAAGELRPALREKSERFRGGLRELGFDTGLSETQIVPAVVGSNESALALARALDERGVLAVAIRPPTVPPGTARVRFSLMATHSDEELGCALAAIEEAGREAGLVG